MAPASAALAVLALGAGVAPPSQVLVSGAVADGTTTVLVEKGRPAVVEKRIIGRTVKDRPIRAWRLGDPDAALSAVAIATLHGDEPAPRQILEQLRDGDPVRGVDLWVVPGGNPDGFVRGTRKNASGVDLNRNFPHVWTHQDGIVESGPEPASEPETRALMRFLRRVDPDRLVSFHQPLHGVDAYDAKRPRFVRRVADGLGLPVKDFPCNGTCHGTLTGWFNHGFAGVAVTVEYGHRPRWRRMNVRAPRQLLRVLGGTR